MLESPSVCFQHTGPRGLFTSSIVQLWLSSFHFGGFWTLLFIQPFSPLGNVRPTHPWRIQTQTQRCSVTPHNMETFWRKCTCRVTFQLNLMADSAAGLSPAVVEDRQYSGCTWCRRPGKVGGCGSASILPFLWGPFMTDARPVVFFWRAVLSLSQSFSPTSQSQIQPRRDEQACRRGSALRVNTSATEAAEGGEEGI